MNKESYLFLGMFIGGLLIFLINIALTEKEPTAMDVYRGNTSLKTTYIDSVAIDSIVVFKDKEK